MLIRRILFISPIVIALSLIIAYIMIANSKPNASPSNTSTVSARVKSDVELHYFFDTEVKGIIDSIVDGNSYPEINVHFKDYYDRIFQKTHKNLNIGLSITHHWASDNIEASGKYDEKTNTAMMEIYVPSLMYWFEINQALNQPHWKEAFKSHIIILFMHEMEHVIPLAPSKEKIDIEEESRAWYNTCTYTIDPLIQKYKLPINNDSYKLYQAWLLSKGDRSSITWYNAVYNLYKPVLGKKYGGDKG